MFVTSPRRNVQDATQHARFESWRLFVDDAVKPDLGFALILSYFTIPSFADRRSHETHATKKTHH